MILHADKPRAKQNWRYWFRSFYVRMRDCTHSRIQIYTIGQLQAYTGFDWARISHSVWQRDKINSIVKRTQTQITNTILSKEAEKICEKWNVSARNRKDIINFISIFWYLDIWYVAHGHHHQFEWFQLFIIYFCVFAFALCFVFMAFAARVVMTPNRNYVFHQQIQLKQTHTARTPVAYDSHDACRKFICKQR